MKKYLFCVFSLFMVIVFAEEKKEVSKLNPFLFSADTLLRMDKKAFEKDYYKELDGKWTSGKKLEYRFNSAATSIRISRNGGEFKREILQDAKDNFFLGARVAEGLFTFKEDMKLSKVKLYLYNRGDQEAMLIGDFVERVKEVKTAITDSTSLKAVEKKRSGAAKEETATWIDEEFKLIYRLEYSYTKLNGRRFRTEYIAYVVEAYEGKKAELNKKVEKVDTEALVDNVKRTDSGDVWLDNIPMVDQGKKGYCACATISRILKYYGRDVDQHEVAKIANSGASFGTSPRELYAALKKIKSKMKLSLKELYHSSDDARKAFKAYNKEMKKLGKPNSRTYYINYWPMVDYYYGRKVDLSIYTDIKQTFRGYDKFREAIFENIDAGMPLPWSLMLGMFPENGKEAKQRMGGHMRLVIGYNKEADELIFSDTWGAGHEKKRMKFVDAYSATMGLWQLEPWKK